MRPPTGFCCWSQHYFKAVAKICLWYTAHKHFYRCCWQPHVQTAKPHTLQTKTCPPLNKHSTWRPCCYSALKNFPCFAKFSQKSRAWEWIIKNITNNNFNLLHCVLSNTQHTTPQGAQLLSTFSTTLCSSWLTSNSDSLGLHNFFLKVSSACSSICCKQCSPHSSNFALLPLTYLS